MLIAFDSTQQALRAEMLLEYADIEIDMCPTPKANYGWLRAFYSISGRGFASGSRGYRPGTGRNSGGFYKRELKEGYEALIALM